MYKYILSASKDRCQEKNACSGDGGPLAPLHLRTMVLDDALFVVARWCLTVFIRLLGLVLCYVVFQYEILRTS